MNQTGKKIVIVEDETVIALEIEEQLKRSGYEIVSQVSYGEEVLDEVKKHLPNLILMDINLKGKMTGIEAAHQVRSFSNTPIVFLTAYGDKKNLEEAKKVAPHGFLTKPFRPQELNAAVELSLLRYLTEEDLRIKQEHFKNLAAKNDNSILTAIPDLMEILLDNSAREKLWNEEKEILSTISTNIEKIQKCQDSLIDVNNNTETANQAKNDFLSKMSHEFRTPLNSIMGLSQLLNSETDNPLTDTQKEKLNSIINSSNHILRLVDNILDQKAIEDGNLPVNLEKVSLNQIIDESFDAIQESAVKKELNVIDNIPANEEVWVLADRKHLKKVLMSLLTNASKYNKYNGSIDISIKIKGPQTAQLKIADTGTGIPQADQSQIFEPFSTLTSSHGFKEGIGLSLYVSKLLMKKMNGDMSFESQFGKGSSFYIDIPFVRKTPVSARRKFNAIGNYKKIIDKEAEEEAGLSNVSLPEEIRLSLLRAADSYNYTKIENLLKDLNSCGEGEQLVAKLIKKYLDQYNIEKIIEVLHKTPKSL